MLDGGKLRCAGLIKTSRSYRPRRTARSKKIETVCVEPFDSALSCDAQCERVCSEPLRSCLRTTARRRGPISLLAKWSCTPRYTPVITRPIRGTRPAGQPAAVPFAYPALRVTLPRLVPTSLVTFQDSFLATSDESVLLGSPSVHGRGMRNLRPSDCSTRLSERISKSSAPPWMRSPTRYFFMSMIAKRSSGCSE